jgi:protein TonB
MRRDLIIGLLCSILLHAGLAWGGNLNFHWNKTRKVAKEDAPTIQLLELPKMEPEEPDAKDPSETTTEVTSLAPPSLAEVPSAVSFGDIVQVVQPPPAPKAQLSNAAPKAVAPSSGLKDVFDLKNLDQQPVLRNSLHLQYPFEMKRLGISGEVVVEFICDENGDVREPHVLRSTRSEFDSAALEAVSRLKFRPGKKGGRAVRARMQQPITFELTQDE